MSKSTIQTPGIKTFKLSQLKAADYNPRTIDDEALAGLTKSIERFGCVEPIIINVRGGKKTIVGGHQRLKALAALGVKQCICVTVDCSAADEKLLNLSLNNPLIQGQFIEDISQYIEAMQKQMPKDTAFLDMRIAELRGEISKMSKKDAKIPDEQFGIFVECVDESTQQKLFERLEKEGYACRLLTL
jgi:ParB-like chromosome segregation protein Spo0J